MPAMPCYPHIIVLADGTPVPTLTGNNVFSGSNTFTGTTVHNNNTVTGTFTAQGTAQFPGTMFVNLTQNDTLHEVVVRSHITGQLFWRAASSLTTGGGHIIVDTVDGDLTARPRLWFGGGLRANDNIVGRSDVTVDEFHAFVWEALHVFQVPPRINVAALLQDDTLGRILVQSTFDGTIKFRDVDSIVGGHIIVNELDADMTTRPRLQFHHNMLVSDNAIDGVTEVIVDETAGFGWTGVHSFEGNVFFTSTSIFVDDSLTNTNAATRIIAQVADGNALSWRSYASLFSGVDVVATFTDNVTFEQYTTFFDGVSMSGLTQNDALTRVLVQNAATSDIFWRASSTIGRHTVKDGTAAMTDRPNLTFAFAINASDYSANSETRIDLDLNAAIAWTAEHAFRQAYTASTIGAIPAEVFVDINATGATPGTILTVFPIFETFPVNTIIRLTYATPSLNHLVATLRSAYFRVSATGIMGASLEFLGGDAINYQAGLTIYENLGLVGGAIAGFFGRNAERPVFNNHQIGFAASTHRATVTGINLNHDPFFVAATDASDAPVVQVGFAAHPTLASHPHMLAEIGALNLKNITQDDALIQVVVLNATTGKIFWRSAASLGGGGGGAPTTAEYIVAAADGTLSSERVATTTATIAWSFAVAGQAQASVPDDAITLAKLQNIATASFLGRTTAATGDPEVLTGTQATALLDVFTTALKGLAPASGGGTTNFLRADGTWAAPGGAFPGLAATYAWTGGHTFSTVAVNINANLAVNSDLYLSLAQDDSLTRVLVQNAGTSLIAWRNAATIGSGGVSFSTTQRVLGRNTAGAGAAEEVTATQVLDWLGATQGQILYRNASAWVALPAGTSGHGLRTQGAGANPTWGVPRVFVRANGVDQGNNDWLNFIDTSTVDFTISNDGINAEWDISANVPNDSITLAKLQNIATASFLGRVTAGTDDPEVLTGTQATTILDAFTSALKGLAPASGGGTTNYLRADGTWAAPPGTGGAGAPSTAEYIVAATDATLSAERVATATGTISWSFGTAGQALASVVASSIGNTQLRDAIPLSLLGRAANTTGAFGDIQATADDTLLRRTGSTLNFGALTAGMFPADIVVNAALADMAAATIKGNNTGGAANPIDLTVAQVTAMLNAFTTSLQGLAPASGGGTTNFLRADGTWTAPPGGGAPTTAQYIVSATDATLSAERVATTTGTISWDFGTAAQAQANIVTNGVGNTHIRQSAGLSVIGRSANSTGNVADITAANDGEVLRRSGTTIGFGTVATAGNADDSITFAKIQNIATARFIGRVTAASGDPEELTGTQATTLLDVFTTALKGLAPASGGGTTNYLRADGTWAAPTGTGGVTDGDKGDIVVSASGATWTIDTAVVTLAKMANIATATFIGRTTAATGVPEALTVTQATAMLNPFTTSLQGVTPASGGGTTNFLRADGTWAAPAGGGGSAMPYLPAFLPYAAEYPATNFPQLTLSNRRPVLAFDATTDETAYWTYVHPQGSFTTQTCYIQYKMASATSGTVGFQVAEEAISDGDSVDLDSATSFDTVNNSASTTVPGTAGFIDVIAITMTNRDSVAAGDYCRIALNRDADGSAVADSATGDAEVLSVEIRFT